MEIGMYTYAESLSILALPVGLVYREPSHHVALETPRAEHVANYGITKV